MSAHRHHSHGGMPVLDIGDDVGALVVVVDDAEEGTELFVRRDGQEARGLHTGVWTRHHRGGHVTAAVFGELVEGRYWVLDADGSDRRPVEIRGGELTELDLRSRIAS